MPPQKGKRQHAAAVQPAKFGIQHFFSRHASSQGSLQPPTQPRPVARTSQEAKLTTFISPNRPPKAKAPPSSLPEEQRAECTPTLIESPEGGISCQLAENEQQSNATSTLHRKRMRLSPGMMLSQTQEDGDEVVWKASPTAERLNAGSSTVTQDQRFALRPCQSNVNERPSSNLQGVCTLVSPCSKISPGIAGKLELWLSSSTAGKDVPNALQDANKENVPTAIDTNLTNSQKTSSYPFVNKKPSPTPRRKSQIAGGSSKRGLARQAKLGKHRKALLELLDQVQSVITEDKSSGKESPQYCNELERRLAQENAFDTCEQEAIIATQLDREAPTGSNSSIPENVDGRIQPSDDIAIMFAKFDCQSTLRKDGSIKTKSHNSDMEAAESQFDSVVGHTNSRSEKEHQPNFHYLVLEVSDFDFQKETCGALYPEKILRLLDETNGAENIVYLRDEWCFTVVKPGDTVNVIGDFEVGKCVIDHENNLLVVHPDVLVSGSRVGSSFSCARRAVLDERIKSFDVSLSALLGTMLHRLFQTALSSEQPSHESLHIRAKDIVVDHIDGLYAIGGGEKEALSKLVDAIPAMLNWLHCYKNPRPSLEPNVDFGMVNGKHHVSVSEVVDIEEMIWSPKYGLKGMIDASVRVRTDGAGSQYVPLEFKTGKATAGQAAMEHRAQVILYTLLMSDRYSDYVNKGILYYLHPNQTQGVPVQHADLTGLMMRRNEHASSLLLASSTQVLPPVLQNSHMCQGCRMVDICSVYHKVQEGGTAETSGLGELFDVLTSHLTQQHAEFLQHWDRLIDLEAQVYQSSQSEIWRMPSSHREEQGRCLSAMIVQLVTHESLDNDKDGEYVYCFRKSNILNGSTSSLQDQAFACGDYVLLSTESGHAAVAGGVIKTINSESLTVSLSHPLRLPGKSSLPDADRILKELWRIDKDDRGSSFAIMRYNMLQLFLKDGARHSRQLIVDLEAPRFESYATISQDPAAIYIRSVPDLNHGQRSAIAKILATKDYSLILGMPGTGKTSAIVHAVQALLARGSSVLLASYTNSAVDNILLKLKHQGVDFLRVGRSEAIHSELSQHAIGAGVTSVEDLRRKIDQAQVVGATCLGITHALFTKRKFDVCIIDEAGQITLPVCLGPLRYAHTFVLVGDHYQLPPLVKNPEAREKGMSISLFRRLSEAHPQAVSALQSQYRMCSDIMNLSNALIYGNRLRCGSAEIANARLHVNIARNLPVWTQQVLDSSRRVLFLDTDGICAHEQRPGNMVQNKTEGSVLIKIICALTEGGVDVNSVGVISPYKAQVDYIRRRLGDHGLSDIEVHTIDKYQGRDKDCIVVSFVRAKCQRISGSLLTDWHRINVAITRAKKKFVMIGSSKTLSSVPLLKLLIDQVAKQGGILRLPEDTLTSL